METQTIIITLSIIVIYKFLRILTFRVYQKIGRRKNFDEDRINASSKAVVNIITVIFVIIMLSVWGIGFKGLHIYLSSIFAVIGVTFFATWSVLSGITAGMIIYFTSDLRLGDTIKIIDGDNSVEGKIVEFGLYAIRIRIKDESYIVMYPNNMAIQKPIVRISKYSDCNGCGKGDENKKQQQMF